MSGVDTVLPRGVRLERDERGHGLIRGSCGTDQEGVPETITDPTKRAGEGVQVGESSTHSATPETGRKGAEEGLRRDPHHSETPLFCKGFVPVLYVEQVRLLARF